MSGLRENGLPESGMLLRVDTSWFGRDTKSVVTGDALRTCLGNGVLVPVEIDYEAAMVAYYRKDSIKAVVDAALGIKEDEG